MFGEKLKKALRYYFITDEHMPAFPPLEQARVAIQAGATMIQYRHKSFAARLFEEVQAVRNLCKINSVPFIVNDNILLAKAVGADGVHLGQEDDTPSDARRVLGAEAVVGISVSNLEELNRSDLPSCNYIGTGPVFPTRTKPDAKKACGLDGLAAVIDHAGLPVVAIGGINDTGAAACFERGAAGVAVISYITRSANPQKQAARLGAVCGCSPRPALSSPWNDEFGLIRKLLNIVALERTAGRYVKIPAGDDACLLQAVEHPVVSTDTHKEGIHFRLDWQTPEEVGRKAVAVTLSDLAACYAKPLCLFVNLSLPAHISEETVIDLYRGVKATLEKYECEMGGGNISRSSELSLDLFAVGQGAGKLFPTRGAARAGDGLYCTGPLGLARAGLDSLARNDLFDDFLIKKFKCPRAQFSAAEVLARHQVACVMDISDGLAGDAGHLAKASGVTVEFDLSDADYHPALLDYCRRHHLQPNDWVLAGGEDYELLFACSPETYARIKKEAPYVFPVGRCIPFTGSYLANLPSGVESYQHGKY